jgi:hypothetical protein
MDDFPYLELLATPDIKGIKVLYMIKKVGTNKAPRPDNIPNRAL